ncbi:FecCD family ABC transporter permease [Sphingopyxis granuli]|uniref:FecCD family ABC transporter permease n=1 Tax=Sphingopyxis granuli TaxID=267128 RepID=UPI001C3F17DE|nr:iron ABC transporter permease [Sphingopyxis granuli]
MKAMLVDYRRTVRRRVMVIALIAAIAVAAFVADLVTGPSGMGARDVLYGIAYPDRITPGQRAIIWDVRLPYAMMAVMVGASLSLAGAEMQTILDNPMASPFTLGVSSAASFGASLAIVLGIGLSFAGSWAADWMVSLNAFLFAFLAMLLLQAVARQRAAGAQTLVLLGIALVFAFNALTSLVQFLSSQEALQQLVFWTMGSLSRATWSNVSVLALVLLAVAPFSLASARALTALRLGEDRAQSFGVDVGRLRFLSLFRISLLAATAVAFVGAIGFIGLVGPHIARMLLGEDHRYLLPASLFTGAAIMSVASALSKLLVPGVLMPVGIVTAMIGVPIFLFLIFRSGRQGA